MKKIATILVLFIFMFSIVPLAFAENDTRDAISDNLDVDDTDEKGEEDDTNEEDEEESETTIRIRERVGDGEIRIRERIKTADSDVRQRVRTAIKDGTFRDIQMERLMKAVEICREKGLKDCERKFELRIKLVEKLSEKDLERLERISERKSKIFDEVEELKKEEKFKEFKGEAAKARSRTKVKLDKARADYKEAKDHFEKAKERSKDAKEKFDKIKDKARACEGDNSEECDEVRKEIAGHAKEFLSNAADSVLDELDKISAKVEESEHLTDAEAEEILADLAEKTDAIEEAKEVIEALDEDSSKEDIKEAASTIKKAWKNTKEGLRKAAGRIVNARIGGVIVQSKQLVVKLERVLEHVAEKGKDTAEVEGLVDEFNAALDNAKADYELAVDALKNKATAKEGHDLLKAAQKDLKEAHKILRDIFKTLKDQGEDLDFDDEEEKVEDELEDAEDAAEEIEDAEEDAAEDAEDAAEEIEDAEEDSAEDAEEDSAEDAEEDSAEDAVEDEENNE